MARRKKPNVWQKLGHLKPYERDAGYVLFGEHDVPQEFVVPGQDADGNLIALGYESEPTTNPILVRWIDALVAFDDREHDKAPLIALLESETEMLPIVGNWLADLVWRYGISCEIKDFAAQRRQLACVLRGFVWSRPKVGRPKGAAYDMPDHIAELRIDNEKATNYQKENDCSIGDAIAVIAREKFPHDPQARERHGISLKNQREGRHTSDRRAAKRRS